MTVTSGNPVDLATFVDGSNTATSSVSSSLQGVVTKANAVSGACSFSHPSTPSLAAAGELLTAWQTNANFVATVREALVAANRFDGDGVVSVSSADVDAALIERGLDQPPGPIDVAAVEMYGQPPYSGFRDDPICMANGNFLLREGDVAMFGVAASLAVVRAYNSMDRRDGVFGPGWTSLVDVALAVEERRVTFRGADGGGSVFHRSADDGSWLGGQRRGHELVETPEGWEVREGHERVWRFDPDGVCVGFTALAAEVTVERRQDAVRFVDATSGRWVDHRLDPATRRVVEVETSDGRSASYVYDEEGRLVAVARPEGDVTYGHDARGFVVEVRDADGIVVCANVYDTAGRVLSQVDNRGRTTTYEYRPDGVSRDVADDGGPPNVMVHDRRGRMTAMIDGLGNTMRITYDDRDEIVQIVDRTGAVTRYAHDERGNLIARTDPDGLTHTWVWDDQDRLVGDTDRAGATTRYHYEGSHRGASRVVQADGSEFRITLDHMDLPVEVVDADGVSARVEWNRDGLVEAIVDGLGNRTTFEYDAAGRRIALDVASGHRADLTLDAAGRLLAVRSADGERRYEYTAAGRLVGGQHETGTHWRGELDEAGDLAAVVDGGGPVVAYERDAVGRVVATVAPDGGRRGTERDPVGRRTATIEATGARTEIDYDPEGRLVLVTDPSGRTWSRELDLLGRPTMSVGPDGSTSLRSYHPNGQLATHTDAAGNQWSYDVDVMGRVVAATDPLGNTTTYRYTPAGRLAEVRSPLGRTEQRHYDAAGRLARIVEPDGSVVELSRRPDGAVRRITRDGARAVFAYDETGRGAAIAGPWGTIGVEGAAGRTDALVGPGGATAHFDYDPRGLLERVTDPAGVATSFAYDDCARPTAFDTAGATTSFTWDASGRLASVTDPYGARTDFERDVRGAIERVQRPEGTATVRTFGPDGRLAAALDGEGKELVAVHRDANGRVVGATAGDARLRIRRDLLGRAEEVTTDAGTVRYDRDADGYLVSISDGAAHTAAFDRTSDGRLLGFTLADGRQVALPDELDLERDGAGRITTDERGRRFAYDTAGRLSEATVDGATTAYGYDDRGLLATERTADGVRTYRYGRAGELLSSVDEHGTETTYTYDAAGRRTGSRATDGARAVYRWDALGRLTGVDRVDVDGAEVRHEIRRDPVGRPVSVDGVPVLWDSEATGNVLGIGAERYVWWGNRVHVATDPDGTWDRRTTDDPWGHDGGTGVRLGYRGELAVDDLLLLGDRAYDTRTRSFLSRDPLLPVAGAVTFAGPYAYAWNDPVNLVDPTGRQPISDEDYAAMREAASKGMFEKAWDTVSEDPWKFLAKAAITIGGLALMGVAIATLGPVGVVLAGAAIGGISAGLNAKIDGKSGGEFWREVGVGALLGGVGGGLARVIPTSAASNLGQRLLVNTGWNAAEQYPTAMVREGLNSYIAGDGTYDWDAVLLDGTINTVGGVAGNEVTVRMPTRGGTEDITPPVGRDEAPSFGRDDLPGIDPDDVPGPRLDEPAGVQGEPPEAVVPSAARESHDLGTASAADLQEARGIGPTLAQRIVDYRAENGGNLTAEQLQDIPGIGPARAQALADAGFG